MRSSSSSRRCGSPPARAALARQLAGASSNSAHTRPGPPGASFCSARIDGGHLLQAASPPSRAAPLPTLLPLSSAPLARSFSAAASTRRSLRQTVVLAWLRRGLLQLVELGILASRRAGPAATRPNRAARALSPLPRSAENASPNLARGSPSCACASRRSRCSEASRRPTCSCWPEMSSRPGWRPGAAPPWPGRRSPRRGCGPRAGRCGGPPAPRPPLAGPDLTAARRTPRLSRGRNSACTSASSAPVRTESAWARPPSTRCSASTRMLFPAPVSPVSTLKPAAKCTSSSSMMANVPHPQQLQHGWQNSRRVRQR